MPSDAESSVAETQKWKAVQLVDGVGVVGGFLKKPTWVAVVRHEGESFVKVGRRESWLCVAASGKSSGQNPLQRCATFEELHRMVQEAASAEIAARSLGNEAPKDGMAGFGLDEEAPAEAQLKKGKGSRKKSEDPVIVRLSLPPRLRGDGVRDAVCLANKTRSGHCFFLHTNRIEWLIELLGHDVRQGGVQYSPPDSKLGEPFFATRDQSWVARAKTPDGEFIRKTLRVPVVAQDPMGQKRALSADEFQEFKRQKLEELKQWQDDVRNGRVQKSTTRGRPVTGPIEEQ